MLTVSERRKVLKFFESFSNIVPLPIKIDAAKWELKRPSTRKQWISYASYSFYVLHTLYKDASLLYAYFFVPDIQLHQLIIHVVLAMATTLFVAVWYFVVYIWDPALFAAYVKITLLGNVGGPLDHQKAKPRKNWTTRMMEYSLQDLIAIMLPYMIVIAVPVITASYVYDPSLSLLLYAALPRYLQTGLAFVVCLLEEIRFLLMSALTVVPIWQLQVIALDLSSSQLQVLVRSLKTGTPSARSTFKSLRCLQLYVSILNDVNSYLIFSWKFVSISLSILAGYAALAHFREHPVFGVMYYLILMDAVLVYVFIYEKAFKIPQMFDEAAGTARLRARTDRPDIFRRQLKSIPRTAIKVGQFHKMERESTLIFMNYVVTNIVNMLVAYG